MGSQEPIRIVEGDTVIGPDGNRWEIAERVGYETGDGEFSFFWFETKVGKSTHRVAIRKDFMDLTAIVREYTNG